MDAKIRSMTTAQLEAFTTTYNETNETLNELTADFYDDYNNTADEEEKQNLRHKYEVCREAILLAMKLRLNQIWNTP